MYLNAVRIMTAAAVTAAVALAPAVSAPAQAASKSTRITLVVHGCDGCSITPEQAGDSSVQAPWQGTTKKVRRGVVHWKVATRHTKGMSFDIVDPQAVALDFVTNIVVAYPGLEVGARVPKGFAAHKKRANGCWAGTSKRSVTLKVRVEQFPGTSDFPPPVMGYLIRPYFIRTARHLRIAGGGAYSQAFHGTIGNQDAYFCAT